MWDTDELYDVRADPLETRNLIAEPRYSALVQKSNKQLFDTLEATGGMYIPLFRDRGEPQVLRRRRGAQPGDFPPWMIRDE